MQPILLAGVMLGLVGAVPKEPGVFDIKVRVHHLKAGCPSDLNCPSMTTVNGQRVRVEIGGQVAVPGKNGRVEFIPCGFRLEVTPTIRPNGTIAVNAVAEDSVGPDAKGNRTLKKDEATTTVRPGETIRLGVDVADVTKGGRYEVELEVLPVKPKK